jgi:hypothetical protein
MSLLRATVATLVACCLAAGMTPACRCAGKDRKKTVHGPTREQGIPSLKRFIEGDTKRIGAFEVGWDPETGKGPLIQHFDDGSRIEICLGCGFKGYTGGLVIGGYDTPGFLWVPARPVRGFAFLNIWCAFDETLHETPSGDNYGFGWSQNFGERSEGERLAYARGDVLHHSDAMVVLESTNEGGCYRATRRLRWTRGDRHVVLAQVVRNTCEHPVSFDYWIGEDPWIGTYKSSEGDVGWVLLEGEGPRILRKESRIEGRRLECAGQYDLGNEMSGEVQGSYSGVANFVRLSPSTPRPDGVYFANLFAHADEEIDEQRPLGNETLTAFNLGWRGVELEPGGTFGLRWAAGIAETTEAGEPPACPDIPRSRWSTEQLSGIVFESEKVDIEILEGDEPGVHLGRVRGEYTFTNDEDRAQEAAIHFPFYEEEGLSYPHEISVDGTQGHIEQPHGIAFKVEVPAGGQETIVLEYVQRIRGCAYGYVTTSARSWGIPLERASFSVSLPSALEPAGPVLGAPFSRARGEDVVTYTALIEDFAPESDITFGWICDQDVSDAPAQGEEKAQDEEGEGGGG